MASVEELKALVDDGPSAETLKAFVTEDAPGVLPLSVNRFMAGVNESIAGVLDFPGEAIAGGLREIGVNVKAGGFRSLMTAGGMTTPPGTQAGGIEGAIVRTFAQSDDVVAFAGSVERQRDDEL